ncbi:MAG: DUF559 domain-containing protein [Patescibacteria group bacterium]
MTHLYNDSNSKTRRRSLRRDQTDAERKLWQILRHRQMDELNFLGNTASVTISWTSIVR